MDLTPCEPWQGRIRADGYGTLGVKMAHRAVYERLVGPIPDGLELDHLCKNRACVNVQHLEPVTRGENIARSDVGRANRRKTHCPHGHVFDGRQVDGRRYCKTCKRAATRRWYAKTH